MEGVQFQERDEQGWERGSWAHHAAVVRERWGDGLVGVGDGRVPAPSRSSVSRVRELGHLPSQVECHHREENQEDAWSQCISNLDSIVLHYTSSTISFLLVIILIKSMRFTAILR